MKVTQMPPVHAANLVVNNDNTAYGVDVIVNVNMWYLEYAKISVVEAKTDQIRSSESLDELCETSTL